MTSTSNKRVIGRWTIGETLGKGGYSWVKKGRDIKTGKIVALKFMEKAGTSWAKEQAAQVETEIEALKAVRHRNVMKLYAYNLNAKYPQADSSKYLDTILLVLEYAPGGELFDILYYTKSLEEKICRTYFRQIVAGLEACHNAGVVHRDLKPQNLLFDSKFNIKITDFGLSKLVKSDADAVMKTTYVGTKGYQAPELLRDEPYDLKCDVFSVGVILFILLAGYPPFEQARANDKWFKSIAAKNYEKFWHSHRRSPIIKQKMTVTTLLQSMLQNDPKERASLKEVKSHRWVQGEVISSSNLIPVLKQRHRMAEQRRLKDVRKMTDLAHSVNKNRAIEGLEKNSYVDFLPEEIPETGFDVYTWGRWTDVYNAIQEFVPDLAQGVAEYDFQTHQLVCQLGVAGSAPIKFTVKVFKSRTWEGKAPKDSYDGEDVEEENKKYMDRVYVVKIVLVDGDRLKWASIKDSLLLVKCSGILKGLPKWAQRMEKGSSGGVEESGNSNSNSAQEEVTQVEADDYDNVLGSGDVWGQQGGVAVEVN